jgi:hypothetical protein
MTMRRLRPAFCLLLLAGAGCAEKRELGVDVFSDDTLPARFTVGLTGTLVMALRSQSFYMRPDKSLVLVTPGSLIIQQGNGSATIASLDSSRRIAVEPIGTSPDSSDAVAAVGHTIRLERVGKENRVRLAVEKP